MENSTYRAGYHDLVRQEILSRIPLNARRILDIGCGTGALGKALKKRQDCKVIGIENNQGAAIEARKNIDVVWENDLDEPQKIKYGPKIDCIVFADILEHLENPWGVFLQYAELLAPEGTIIISIPNIAHPSIVNDLKLGLFRYQNAGILDITHLRFFTKTSITSFLAAHDFKIKDIVANPSERNPVQFLITVKKFVNKFPMPHVTLLMPTYNTKNFTSQAIKSIFNHTIMPFKLIVIDNNSSDGSLQMLREDDRFVHVENSENLGFPKAINCALNYVSTEFFAILNSDIILTKNWLSHMVFVMKSDPQIGIVGPKSNNVSGPQIEKKTSYETGEELQKFAEKYMRDCTLMPYDFSRIVFFCTLLKSELIIKIGLLDEIFGMGNFEDDDYCLRAAMAGYKCVIDNAVFVHHFGSVTFKETRTDYSNSIRTNKLIFENKWSNPSSNKHFGLNEIVEYITPEEKILTPGISENSEQ